MERGRDRKGSRRANAGRERGIYREASRARVGRSILDRPRQPPNPRPRPTHQTRSNQGESARNPANTGAPEGEARRREVRARVRKQRRDCATKTRTCVSTNVKHFSSVACVTTKWRRRPVARGVSVRSWVCVYPLGVCLCVEGRSELPSVDALTVEVRTGTKAKGEAGSGAANQVEVGAGDEVERDRTRS